MVLCCCCWPAPPDSQERLVDSAQARPAWNLLPIVTINVDRDQYLLVDWPLSVASLSAVERQWGGRVCAAAWSTGWSSEDFKCAIDESFTTTDLIAWIRIACFDHLSGTLLPPQAVTIYVSR